MKEEKLKYIIKTSYKKYKIKIKKKLRIYSETKPEFLYLIILNAKISTQNLIKYGHN